MHSKQMSCSSWDTKFKTRLEQYMQSGKPCTTRTATATATEERGEDLKLNLCLPQVNCSAEDSMSQPSQASVMVLTQQAFRLSASSSAPQPQVRHAREGGWKEASESGFLVRVFWAASFWPSYETMGAESLPPLGLAHGWPRR
jgi:hypothetical protein